MKAVYLFALLPALALANPAVTISTGSEAGTYHKALQSGDWGRGILEVCGLPLQEATSKGSNENIERAARNQTHAFFAQTDALFMYDGQVKKLDNVKTIVSLYPEEVHFLTPVQSKFKRQLVREKVFNTVADLAEMPVGAIAGSGSATTAEFLAGKLGSGGKPFFDLKLFPDEASLKSATAGGQIAAAVLVGGQPLEQVERFGPSFKILPVDDGIVSRVSRYYDAAKLSYSKMGARGTPTIATKSGIFGRTLNDKEKVATFAALRACITEKLGQLQDDGIPKWADVKPEDRGNWSWYDLPSPSAPAAAAPAKKRR